MARKIKVSTAYSETHTTFVAFRQNLRQLLADHGVASNPGVSEDWIVDQLRYLLKKRNDKAHLTEHEIDRAGDILSRRRGSFHF